NAASLRRGMRHRGLRTSRPGELPPDLLSVGVVGVTAPTPEPEAAVEAFAPEEPEAPAKVEAAPRRPRGRKSGARTRTSKATAAVAETAAPSKPRRPRGGARARKKPAPPPAAGGEG
ncbi:MAG TPA: hypothetical protein VJO52_06545, partial [Gemmatimonadaceae bacterium]|nr:hypothetical protein [Gemmatimonadaceae bacterium]